MCPEAAEYSREIPGGIVGKLEKRLGEGVELDVGTDDGAGLAEGLAAKPVERR